jgi:diadenosine tetraphosphatase ApaH/serine/threonine PP2A family protein phosphatase
VRVAVLSDIHSNRPALEAVLAALPAVDAIWQLGDVVGYGPHPVEVIERLSAAGAGGVRGNHDAAALGAIDTDWFNGDARTAVEWSRGQLTDPARAWLSGLPETRTEDAFTLAHASPRDPVWEYVLTWEAARDAIEDSGAELTLVGHSHVPLAIVDGRGSIGGHAAGGTELDLVGGRWLLNPGSVGQPRDGDPNAAWLLLDLGARHASFRRVPYDVARTQAEIREQGLPDALAERLAYGV